MLAAAPLALLSSTAYATDATWTGATDGDYGLVSNWNSTVPDGTATFDSSGITKSVTVSGLGGFTVGGWTFNSGSYQFDVSGDTIALGFNGAGIVVNGGSAAITTDSLIRFNNSSTAGNATFTVNSYGSTVFASTASGGTARFILNGTGKLDISQLTSSGTTAGSIEGDGNVVLGSKNLAVGGNNLTTTFSGIISGSGGSLTKEGTGTLTLSGANSYTGATTVNGGILALSGSLASSQIKINSSGEMDYLGTSTAGSATISTAHVLRFNSSSSAGSAIIDIAAGYISGGIPIDQGTVSFNNSSSAGSATITNGGSLGFNNSATAAGAKITNSNTMIFTDASTAGSAAITNNSVVSFRNTSTAGSATITSNGPLNFFNSSKAGSAAITTNSGFAAFWNTSSAGNATITNNSGSFTLFSQTASGGTASFTMNGTGALDISYLTNGGTTVGSIAGDGDVFLGSNNLAVGGNDTASTFSGVIQDGGLNGGSGGSLTKDGTGTLTLSGANTYTGDTTVKDGTLEMATGGSLASTALNLDGGVFQLNGGSLFGGADINFNGGTFRAATNTSQSVNFIYSNTSGSAISAAAGKTLNLSAAEIWYKDGKTLTFGSASDTGTVALTAGAIYHYGTYAIDVAGGTLKVGNSFTGHYGFYSGAGDAMTVSGTLDANGFDTTVGTLSGAGTVTNNGGSAATLAVFSSANSTFSGTIADGAGGLGLSINGTTGTTLTLSGASTYTGSTTINAGILALSGSLTSSQIAINSNGEMDYLDTATAGSATITSSGVLGFLNASSAGSAAITNAFVLAFQNSSTAGSATIVNNDLQSFYDTSTAGSATITNNGGVFFLNNTTAGSASITNSNNLDFYSSSTAGSATITNNSGGTTYIWDAASGGTARFILNGTGGLDLSLLTSGSTTAGSIEGDGNVFLGASNLAVGGNGLSTTFSGVIQDGGYNGGNGGSLTKTGSGTLTLTGTNTYTGGTTINSGTLTVGNNSALGTGDVAMAAGTTLGFASGNFTLANNIAMTGDPAFDVGTGNTVTLSGVLSDTSSTNPGVVEKSGDGTLILIGANTYSGGTILNAGTLQVSDSNSLGDTSGDLTVNGGTLQWGASFDDSRAITLNNGGGTFDTDGFNNTLSGAISGTGALTKTGNGLLTLSGANTYTGATTVNVGTLALSGSLASSQITTNSGGVMMYLGSSTAGSATITNNAGGLVTFRGSSTAGTATITSDSNVQFVESSTAGSATITNNKDLSFYDTSSAGSATITNTAGGALFFGGSGTAGAATITTESGGTTFITGTASGGSARFILNGTGQLDLSYLYSNGTIVGSIEGDGTVHIGTANLAVGGNNLDTTFSGVIDNNGRNGGAGGGLTKAGTGTLTLSGANTYRGGTTINAGTLSVANASALGTGEVTMAAGTTLGFAGNYTLANNFGLTGDPTFDIASGNTDILTGVISDTGSTPGVLEKTGGGTLILTGANTYSGGTTIAAGTLQGDSTSLQGNIADNATLVFDQASAGTFTGVVSGTGSLTKDGNGTLVLSGANTYSGGTTIAAGTLQGDSTSLQGNIADNAALVFDQASAGTFADVISGSGSLAKDGGGTLILSGANSYSGGTTVSAGTLQGDTASLQGDIADNAALVFDQTGEGTFGDVISGTGSLTKDGTGNLILSAANTYTGATTVNAGTLSVNGSIAASSALTVNAGGTVGGTGALPSTVIASGGTLAPGNSIGTVTVNGDLTLNSGAIYAVQVSPSAADETLVTGNAIIDGELSTTFANGTYAPGSQYTLINAGGTLSGTFAGFTTTNLPYSYTAQLSYDPNNVFLTLYPVVDPKGAQIYAARTTTDIADERMIRDAVLGHLAGPADGTRANGIAVWGQGFAGYGTFDDAAVAHNHAGGIAGVDVGLDDGVRVGLAGAYTTSRTSIPATMAHASGNSGHVIGYARWTDGHAALRGGGSYGWGTSDVTRTVPSLAETDRGHQAGRTAQVFAEAGYKLHADGGILEPHAGLVWVHAATDAFKETGTFASVTGAATHASATFAVLGLRAALPEIPLGAVRVAPHFDLGWQHGLDVSTPRQSLTINTTGLTATIPGLAIDSDAATAQIGADIAFAPDLTLQLGYDGLMASRASDNAVSARLNWRF